MSYIEDPFQLCICATLFTGIYSDLANLSDMYDALSDIQLYEQTRTRYQLKHQHFYKKLFGTCTSLYKLVPACTSHKSPSSEKPTSQV